MSWTSRSEALVESLAAVGITATLDPRKCNPPCALIVPPTLKRVVGAGLYAAWHVHLVAPGNNDLDSITWLLDNLEAAFNAVGADSAEFANIALSPDAGTMPGYTLTIVSAPL